MDAVITKKQKNVIMILGGVTGLLGAVAGSLGLYLRTELLTSDRWEKQWIEEFTQGYFGIMSGYLLFLLGTVGFSLIYTRMFCLVLFYVILSLSCDGLCVVDVLLVLPYTKDYGKYAWEEPLSCTHFNSTTNFTTIMTPYPFTTSEMSCKDIKIISILLITITVSLLLTFLLSMVTTTVTAVSLCRARGLTESTTQPPLPLTPFTAEDLFTVTNYNNILYGHNDGYKPG